MSANGNYDTGGNEDGRTVGDGNMHQEEIHKIQKQR